jgi:hypothetical protein
MKAEGDWGCPDWQNRDAYPKNGKALKRWQWRWEFLRRTPDYRELWEERSQPDSIRYVTKLNVRIDNWVHQLYNLDILIDPANSLSDFEESPFIYKVGDSFRLPSRQSLKGEWFEQHGVDTADPEAKLDFLIYYLELVGLLESSKPTDPGDLFKFFRIDLLHPINDQFKYLKSFKESQEKEEKLSEKENDLDSKDIQFPKRLHFKKESRTKWPFYLRLIDARYQSAEPVVIFKQIQNEMEADGLDWRKWEDSNNPAAKIMIMQKSAWELMIKVSLFL